LKSHKLFYQSSYDRGVDILLNLWPQIKLAFPDATLDICYGWDLFVKANHNNPERMIWKEKIVELMGQVDVTEHGRLGKKELQELRKSCGVLAYPSYFPEISCISVMEAMRDGLVPVTTDIAALKETNDVGVLIKGDIYDPRVQQEFLTKLLEVMGDEKLYEEKKQKCFQKSKKYSWDKTADRWQELFGLEPEQPLVSIVTPTIRSGWWNLMAHNIKEQTYKNIEWIIVDDHKDDRSKLALEYAEKFKINIRYVRGKKRAVKRSYGLCNANNTGLQEAKGELMVILQDFIVMPKRGIEMYVDVYRRNPNALIAGTDYMFKSKMEPNIKSEDWFNGETDVRGDFIWKNVRNLGVGMRPSDNPYEFEQNYCAIPTHIAKALNGWWTFYDYGLGFDNTSFANRALKSGYKLLVDDTNAAYGIDHWAPRKHLDKTLYDARHRTLSNPRYLFEHQMIKLGKLPLVRDEKLDDLIELKYDIPAEIENENVVKWLQESAPEMVEGWYKDLVKKGAFIK